MLMSALHIFSALSQQMCKDICAGSGFLKVFPSLPLCVQVAKAVSHSLNNCVNCLPGQKDVDVALKSIGESSKKLLVDSVRSLSGKGYLAAVHPRREHGFPPPWISEHLSLKSPNFLPFSISFLVNKHPKGGIVREEFVLV